MFYNVGVKLVQRFSALKENLASYKSKVSKIQVCRNFNSEQVAAIIHRVPEPKP